jgi:hypothetical protein
LKREEAVAILKEIVEKHSISLKWVSLENIESDSYELHLKLERGKLVSLKLIVEKHNLELKEANGDIIIYRERARSERS